MKISSLFLICAFGTLPAAAATLSQSGAANRAPALVGTDQSGVVEVGHLGVCDTAIACGNPPVEPSETVKVGHLGVCDTANACGNPPAEQSKTVEVGHLGVCDTAIGCDFSPAHPQAPPSRGVTASH